jgi:hypothetical protein
VLSFFGLIHAGKITDAGVAGVFGWAAAPAFAAAYFCGAIALLFCHWSVQRKWIECAGNEAEDHI